MRMEMMKKSRGPPAGVLWVAAAVHHICRQCEHRHSSGFFCLTVRLRVIYQV